MLYIIYIFTIHVIAGDLMMYKDSRKLPNINTFGFGYSLDTSILLNLAKEGNGMHAFIPDASFVGTAFVNAISNLMVPSLLSLISISSLSHISPMAIGNCSEQCNDYCRTPKWSRAQRSTWSLFPEHLMGNTDRPMLTTIWTIQGHSNSHVSTIANSHQ